MSVVAISSRPQPPGRTDRFPVGRPGPILTVTLDLGSGTGVLTPRLARLVELLGELVEAGEGMLRVSGAPGRPAAPLVAVDPTRPAVDADRSGGPASPRAADAPPSGPADAVQVLAGSRVVRQHGQVVPLTRIEFDLLLFLAEHPRRVFTRRQLLAHVWGYEHAVARTVDVHVRRLRVKLPGGPLITTVHGVGYRLADEARVGVDRHR